MQITQEQGRQFEKLSGTRDLNSRNADTARRRQSPYNRIVRISGLGRFQPLIDFVVFDDGQDPVGDPNAQGYYSFYVCSPSGLDSFLNSIKKIK